MFETYFWKSIVGIDDQQARLSTAALQRQQRVAGSSSVRRKDQASLGWGYLPSPTTTIFLFMSGL
jgi:hypothetical protein